jgi:hypothetical protein
MAFERKVAIITGASKGIGACLLRGFRERGYGVVANSRSMKGIVAAGDPEILVVEHERVWCDRLSHYRREPGSNPPHQGVQPVCSPEYVRLAGDACPHGLTSTHNRSNRDTMLAGSAVTLSRVV